MSGASSDRQALRVVLATSGGLSGALVLDRLLASPRVEVAGIVLSSRLLRSRYGFARGAAEYLRLTGIAYTLYLWCSTSLADALLRAPPVLSVARRAHRLAIPLLATRRVNEEAAAFIAARSPDLLVSAFFNQRIGEALARLPPHGAVNIHPSPLPEGRGVDPVFFARRRGTMLGASVHRIAPELDAGAVLACASEAARAGESVLWATARLYDRGAALLLDCLDDIRRGAPGTPQPREAGYDSWPSAADVAALRRAGTPLARARDLINLARGRLPGREPR